MMIRWLIIIIIFIEMVWDTFLEFVSLVAVWTVVTVVSVEVISRSSELMLVKIMELTGSLSYLKWCWARAFRASLRHFESKRTRSALINTCRITAPVFQKLFNFILCLLSSIHNLLSVLLNGLHEIRLNFSSNFIQLFLGFFRILAESFLKFLLIGLI